jgi:WXG100 family type VII secretion target
MGKTISVSSFDEMAKASQKLESLSETYTEIYTQLLQEANTMGSAWEGADNLAFVEQINGFTQELKDMAQKLSLASQALDKQRANYVAQQESNITQVKKLVN